MLVQDFFAASRARYPARIAVHGARPWSYEELGTYADRVGTLIAQRAPVGSRVGLWMHRGPEALGALLGILAAGCVAVPLDPDSPGQRIGMLLSEIDAKVVLAGAEFAEQLATALATASGVRDVIFTRPARLAAAAAVACIETQAQQAVRLPPPVTDVDVAWILFTSGSTGRPKGVMIPHRAVVDFVRWAIDAFDLTVDDHVAQPSPLFFDLSVFDIWASFAVGATVHVVSGQELLEPVALARFLEERKITVWLSVPRVLSWLATHRVLRPGIFTSLRAVLFCGEPLSPTHLAAWMAVLPACTFANLYGPTETTVASTWHTITSPPTDLTRPIPIGRPCKNSKVLLLKDHNRVCDVGEEGEICIGGSCVMLGYFGRPDLTEQALVQNPLHLDYQDLFYRTGDYGSWDHDGVLHFHGRRDSQVKVGSVRIELGEIEAVLSGAQGVQESCALVTRDAHGSKVVVAFYATSEPVDEDAVWKHLFAWLPPSFLPRRLEKVPVLPRLPNGKVDRVRCLAP